MSALDYFKDVVFNKYAQFDGRARRSEFWYFVLINMLIQLVVGGLGEMMGSFLFQGLSGLISLALLVPGIAVAVRRLHDTGRSGWNLLWALLPIVGAVILIVFYAKDSDPGSNQYGPNPKTGESDDGLFDDFVGQE